MNVIDRTTKQQLTFRDLKPGDSFYDPLSGREYLKITQTSGTGGNALRMNDYFLTEIFEISRVRLVDDVKGSKRVQLYNMKPGELFQFEETGEICQRLCDTDISPNLKGFCVCLKNGKVRGDYRPVLVIPIPNAQLVVEDVDDKGELGND